MRFALLLAAVAFLIAPASSQPLLTENFDYAVGDTLTVPPLPWIHHSGSGDSLLVTDNNLTFTGYPPSTGFSTFVAHGAGSREDAHLDFTPVSGSGTTVYAAFLINASSVTTDSDGGYFFHFAPGDPYDFDFTGRVYLRNMGEPVIDHLFSFGISKGSGNSDIVWDTVVRDTGTTYLLVLKYTFVPDASPGLGGGTNDPVDLYVFEDGDDISVEPGSPTISADIVAEGEADIANIGNVNLRQGSDTMGLTVDGIQVALSWADVVPVELVSFEANVSGSDINLNWLTSSETNNAGFEIQLRGSGDYEAMGFVDGHGTTSVEQSYAYTINNLTSGVYTVRLKQIDFDGAFEYSPEIEIAVGVPGTHVLTQAYPNPFNPQASFSLSVAAAQHVEIALYDQIGRQVATLFSGQMEEGQARAFTIDGANLPSGSYYYQAIGRTFSETGRVTLLK
ncbi:MAG: T9SS type A sorting domain-containing protein [Bacteroidetes bacterium]|nr:T9SS type A sorting domain-containing protein [Bacteroidota bacterium]